MSKIAIYICLMLLGVYSIDPPESPPVYSIEFVLSVQTPKSFACCWKGVVR